MEISLLGALVGGMLTLLSPCSVMLLPAFFSYAFLSPGMLLARTGVFYLGLVTTLVPLGLLAGSLGSLMTTNRAVVVAVASALLMLLGLAMIVALPIPGLSRASGVQGTSTLSVFVLGTVYGFAGACTGPLLGAVLTLAAVSGQALWGGVLLLVFAIGMTIPLLVLATLWVRAPGIRSLVRPRELIVGRLRTTWSGLIGGLLTIGVGLLLLFSDGTTALGGILGATDQYRIESDVMAWTSHVPDVGVVLVAVSAVAAGWWARRMLLTKASGAATKEVA